MDTQLTPRVTHTHSLTHLSHTHSGTVEDTELVHGVVFNKRFAHTVSGLDRMEKAKIALVQFCLSPPKTDVRQALSDATSRTFVPPPPPHYPDPIHVAYSARRSSTTR